ncbi:MAG TPA: aspartate aminotransferase family protein [Candidatus Atribacteria bacterium]|nr:aspartate aminotransferase family protein [Candidatus Atribacteria bacterium]
MTSSEIIEKEARYFLGTYSRLPVVLERGEGCYVFDLEGKRYLDLMAGIAVNILGYSFPPLKSAVKEEVDKLLHASNLYYSVPQVELAERLVKKSGFSQVFLVNSGAEANEVALKMARFYRKRKYGKGYKFISFYRSFHGRTLLTLGLTAQEKFHKDLDPFPPGIEYATLNNLESVEKVLDDEVCAIIVEPVQGEGGIYPCNKEFLLGLRKLCDEKDLVLIFDEVQCGMGRVGKFFAFESFEVRPDIVTLAKGLGGGLPLGAVLVDEETSSSVHRGDQGSTFGGNPVCSRAACVVVDEVSKESFLSTVREKGKYFEEQLKKLASIFPMVKEVRGRGLMLGFEVPGKAKKITEEMLKEGVLVNACNDDTVRFLPPLIITQEEIDEGVEALKKVLERI